MPETDQETDMERISVSPDIKTISEFNSAIKGCMNCPLGSTRTNFVFGAGNPNADIMFVGEAPGEKEDLEGLPFEIGRAHV